MHTLPAFLFPVSSACVSALKTQCPTGSITTFTIEPRFSKNSAIAVFDWLSWISSILCVKDQTLVRKMLGSNVLCGLTFNQACRHWLFISCIMFFALNKRIISSKSACWFKGSEWTMGWAYKSQAEERKSNDTSHQEFCSWTFPWWNILGPRRQRKITEPCNDPTTGEQREWSKAVQFIITRELQKW